MTRQADFVRMLLLLPAACLPMVACDVVREPGGAAGKGTNAPDAAGAPTLQQVDSIILAESDTLFVGLPAWFQVAGDGTYLVVDAQNVLVHHYGADGRYLRRIGRRGGGPGELVAPNRLALAGDSLLYVADEGFLETFDFGTGEFLRQVRIGKVVVQTLAAASGRVLFDDVDHESELTIAAVDADGQIERGGPFPQPMGRSRILDEFFSALHIASIGRGDTIAVAIQNSNRVWVGSFRNGAYTAYEVAARARRGAPEELLATITDDHPDAAQNALYKLSLPVAIGRLSDGNLAYVAADENMVDNRRTARLYVSVIDPKTRRSCVDALVPVDADPHPYAALRGDTVVVLNQEVLNETSTRLIVRKYTIRTATCEWVPEQSTPQ